MWLIPLFSAQRDKAGRCRIFALRSPFACVSNIYDIGSCTCITHIIMAKTAKHSSESHLIISELIIVRCYSQKKRLNYD